MKQRQIRTPSSAHPTFQAGLSPTLQEGKLRLGWREPVNGICYASILTVLRGGAGAGWGELHSFSLWMNKLLNGDVSACAQTGGLSKRSTGSP